VQESILFEEFVKAVITTTGQHKSHILVKNHMVKIGDVVPDLFQCVEIPADALEIGIFLAKVRVATHINML